MALKRKGTEVKWMHAPTTLRIEHRMIGILLPSVTLCKVTSCGSAARLGRRVGETANRINIRVPTASDAVETDVRKTISEKRLRS